MFASRTRWIVLSIVVLAALYVLAVAPVRTYFSQRHQMAVAAERYKILADANKQMNDRIGQLKTDAEIERLAREQYELVPQGQEAFAVMPPQTAAADQVEQKKKSPSLFAQVWDSITFWN